MPLNLPISSKDVILIDDRVLNKYTAAWTVKLYEDNQNGNLQSYFMKDGTLITCVLFSIKAAECLLSSEGVASIKSRFCITPDGSGGNCFNVALFGVDRQGQVNSANYLGVPWHIGTGHPGTQPDGNVPNWLARSWINNWRNNSQYKSGDLFSTSYGSLLGYTYTLTDMIDALYDSDDNDENEYLCMHFALHNHYPWGETNPLAVTSTFNMVLQRVVLLQTQEGYKVSPAPVDGVYYDISAPSPPY